MDPGTVKTLPAFYRAIEYGKVFVRRITGKKDPVASGSVASAIDEEAPVEAPREATGAPRQPAGAPPDFLLIVEALNAEENKSKNQGGKKYACFSCEAMIPHRGLEPSIRPKHIKCQEAAENEYETRYHKICLECEVKCLIEEEKDEVRKEVHSTDDGRTCLRYIAMLQRNYKSVKPRVKKAECFAQAMAAAERVLIKEEGVATQRRKKSRTDSIRTAGHKRTGFATA